MRISVVTTTINEPTFLVDYIEHFNRFRPYDNHEITFIIVGDNKTPKAANRYEVDGLWNVEYWSPKRQEDWIDKTFPDKKDKVRVHVPENDVRRRNFGFLRAVELDSDLTITIDDDNLPDKDDWIGCHIDNKVSELAWSRNNFVNPCNILYTSISSPIYSRGYPYSYLYSDSFMLLPNMEELKSILNVGLWAKSPDVDAYTNIVYNPVVLGSDSGKIGINNYNYFPVNTQNTSFTKKLPIFHCIYQEPVFSLPSHRYDDVWMGLFVQKLIHRFGDTASFGSPIVRHERNTHNFCRDLQQEFVGSVINTRMWESIRDLEIDSTDYIDGFLDIACRLPGFFRDYNTVIQKYVGKICQSMFDWVELIDFL